MRKIYVIAAEIADDWASPYFGAMPYLQAMHELSSMDDYYGCDSAESIIRYFLGNASSWRGDTAQRIKSELNSMLKTHDKK